MGKVSLLERWRREPWRPEEVDRGEKACDKKLGRKYKWSRNRPQGEEKPGRRAPRERGTSTVKKGESIRG